MQAWPRIHPAEHLLPLEAEESHPPVSAVQSRSTARPPRSCAKGSRGLMPINGVTGRVRAPREVIRLIWRELHAESPDWDVIRTATRLAEKIEVDPITGCWLWRAFCDEKGYARLCLRFRDRKETKAYRVTYRLFKGDLPPGLEPDHLCRVRSCINPAHLEAVTHAVNNARSNSASALAARKTHCAHGHEFSEANTYCWRGHRKCRPCRNARLRAGREAAL